MKEIIDLFGVIVGILGLVALWVEPKTPDNRRRYIALAGSCLMAVAIPYVVWNVYSTWREEKQDAQTLDLKEVQVLKLLCDGDENYEEIYQRTSMGFGDKVLNEAIDDLVQSRQLVSVVPWSVPNPKEPNRQVSVRFYHLTDRSGCVTH